MIISENKISEIVSNEINKFIINETFTNMKQLYHKMPIDSLVNMVRVNSFFLSPSNHEGRGGKYYASLSRHKNNIEGFDVIDYAALHENEIDSYCTITFNIPKLTRIHGISIKPFDYYANARSEDEEERWRDDGVPSKLSYQVLKKPLELMSDEERDNVYGYDNTEYYNMAEENIISDTVKEIPEIFNYIDRIDLFFPIDLEIVHTDDYDDYYYENEDKEKTYMFANVLCDIVIGTSWENKIFVNLTKNDNVSKTISVGEFNDWIKASEDFKKSPRQAKNFIKHKPYNRDSFYSDYIGYGHGYGHGQVNDN